MGMVLGGKTSQLQSDDALCSGCREEPELCSCSLRNAEGFFGPVKVNGQSYQLARVRFAAPAGFRHLLNPFAQYGDSSGRRFSVKSFSHKARIIASVKEGKPLDVLCRPNADGFELVHLGLDWLD